MAGYSELVLDENQGIAADSSPEESGSPRNSGRRTLWLSLALVGVIAAALGVTKVVKGKTNRTTETNPLDFQQLFDAEVGDKPMTAAAFITSRSLAQVGAFSFDAKCPMEQPICNPEVVFAAEMKKGLETMKKIAPDIYEVLNTNTLTPTQQEMILRISLLLKNKEVLGEGQVVAETVKHWATAGAEVVHAKVQEALLKYRNEHGTLQDTGSPKIDISQPGSGNVSMWEVLMEPHLLSHIRDTEKDGQVARQLHNEDVVTAGDVFGGFFGWMFPFVFLIFEILHYNHILLMHKMMRVIFMWFSGVSGSIVCLSIAACPPVFLAYWLQAWLLFGNKPSEMKGVPWDFMLRHLPGLQGTTRKLAAVDPLIAA
jgi:hypothetical protein